MKKILLLGSVFFSLLSQAQTFTDNFDSYTAGSYLCPQSSGAWTTWTNAPGSASDVKVSNTDAVSLPNSLRFTSTVQNGGPTDLIRHFGVLNTGQFTLEFNMKVANASSAYFNLQKTANFNGANNYALDAFFQENGTLTFDQHPEFSVAFPHGTWFNFRLEIDFNLNKWEVFINNVSAGYFSNSINQIEAIDIYPVDNTTPYNSDFYIDDFSTIINAYTLPSKNGSVNYLGFDGGNVLANSVLPSFRVRNLGTTAINSFDIAVDYNGSTLNQSYTGVNLSSLAEQSFVFPASITLVSGNNNLNISISNVNGQLTDDDSNDDTSVLLINPVIPAVGKMVITEEGTGTWCGWCVRGAVYMDFMHHKYDKYWTGIAVHNGDPMTVSTYDTPIDALIGGYPSALVDRGAEMDPSEIESEILTRLQVAPKATLLNGATWDAATRKLNISVSATFLSSATNAYKIACALVEDSVKGTTSGYAQSNYYSSSSQNQHLIDLHGIDYNNLPATIPASQMNYNHVARAIAPSFNGTNVCLPTIINNGETQIVNFSFSVPASWDESQLKIVSMLIDPNGKIDNGGRSSISEAVANGFVTGCNAGIGQILMDQVDDIFQIAPNPTTNATTISINLTKDSDVNLRVLDMSGKEITTRNYGTINGSSIIDMNTSKFDPGVYLIELNVNNQKLTKRLIIR